MTREEMRGSRTGQDGRELAERDKLGPGKTARKERKILFSCIIRLIEPLPNSFHPALKFTRQISETSVTFIGINIFVQDNNLATSVH